MSVVCVNWANVREKLIDENFVRTNTTVHNKRMAFEWSDSKVRTNVYNIVNGPTVKHYSVAFI